MSNERPQPAHVDLDKLTRDFPREAVKQRPVGGNRKASYVDGQTVIRRLNEATGNDWTFTVDRYWTEGNVTLALVTLTIPGHGSRQHIGVQSNDGRSGEDAAAKGPITDALKKAATLFGVGLEFYGPDYEGGETTQQPPTKQRQPKPTPPDPDAKLTKYRTRVNELWEDATMAGHREQAIIDHLRTTYQTPTINGLDLDQLSELGHWLHELAAQPADVEAQP